VLGQDLPTPGSTTVGSTGREELDECQEGVQQLVVQAERN
jgi:hypothetical protein